MLHIRRIPGFWFTQTSRAFYGSDSRPEIAAYAFDVLSRQMMAERKKYQDKHCKRCGPSTRVARGDQFCEGWVFGARDVIAVYDVSRKKKPP